MEEEEDKCIVAFKMSQEFPTSLLEITPHLFLFLVITDICLMISGLQSVFRSAASSLQWQSPCTLRARFCPLLIQTRHKNNKRSRFKAPHEPTQKDKWSKVTREK